MHSLHKTLITTAALTALTLCGVVSAEIKVAAAPKASTGFIVQAQSATDAARAVRVAGGRVTHELPIINGVSANLNASQVAKLRRQAELQLFADTTVKTQGTPVIDKYARAFIGADLLAAQGFSGSGVKIKVA